MADEADENNILSDKADDSDTVEDDSAEPKDKFHAVYFAMVVVGAGFLFPYNSFIAAADYFFYVYPGYYPEVVFPFVYMYVTLASIMFTLATAELFPLHGRIGYGYVSMFVGSLIVPLVDIGIHNCTLPTSGAFGLTIVSIVLISMGSGVQQSSYYGLTGMLSKKKYVQALMVGESICGIVVSISRVVTRATFEDERTSTIVFLVASMIFIIVCAFFQIFLKRSLFVRFHVRRCASSKTASTTVSYSVDKNDKGEIGTVENEIDTEVDNDSEGRVHLLEDGSEGETTSNNVISFCLKLKAALRTVIQCQNVKAAIRLRWMLMKIIWPFMLAVFVNFFLTLLLFPGITTLVQECSLGGWTPIILVVVFNTTDLVGKCLSLIRINWKGYLLIIASLSRIIFIPLLLITVSPSPTYPVFKSLWFAAIVVLGIGLSSGYFGTVPMILAPLQAPENSREVAGIMMTLFLLSGLTAGATLAYALVPLTQLRETVLCSNTTAVFSCQSVHHMNTTVLL